MGMVDRNYFGWEWVEEIPKTTLRWISRAGFGARVEGSEEPVGWIEMDSKRKTRQEEVRAAA